MSENREEILANFQSISGIDDIGEAFSHLEEASWDLMVAIQHVIPQEKVTKEEPLSLNYYSTISSNSINSAYTVDNIFGSVPSTSAAVMNLTSEFSTKAQEELISFNIHFNQQILKLRLSSVATIGTLKERIFKETEVPIFRQLIRGWAPSKVQDAQKLLTKLLNLDVSAENELILIDLGEEGYKDIESTLAIDSDSSVDEFEDASDFNACEEFFTDSTLLYPPSRNLIANQTDDEFLGATQFIQNYITRFGEPNPLFFRGTLENALKEACHKPAKYRKLLAIYLHHGESILTNVFCDHLMKNASVRQTLMQNFILFGWDLTFESNKNLFLSSIAACIGNTASVTVRNLPLDKLPAILIIGKSRLSGRSTCEVLSVIHGNVGLDDLLPRLIEAVEMYSEHIQVEIREESERAARDQVKAEQDMAYQETLKADIAKEAVKLQKEAAIVAERQKMEFEKAEKNAKKEALKFKAQEALPFEPEERGNDITKIRFRKPTGEFLERRFLIQNTLKDLLNYVIANGFMIDEYKVISSWPRKDLTSIDSAQTLHNLKLFPQETVILEER